MKTNLSIAIATFAALAAIALNPTAEAQPVNIDLVTVGNPGNAADSTGYGSVGYNYSIGKYDVTISQYTAFLNAVAANDPVNLYISLMTDNPTSAGIARSGSPGSYTYSVIGNTGQLPIACVNWFRAARFCNWLQNGQPSGPEGNGTTESGAYTLGTGAANPEAIWRLPTVDEWYKAAYYDPNLSGTGGYWLYPTRSNSAPGNNYLNPSLPNQANYYNGVFSVTQSSSFNGAQNYLTPVGAFTASASAYGTYDQGGDVWQWIDDGGARGGFYSSNSDPLQSSSLIGPATSRESLYAGIRVVSVAPVPEPSTYALLGLAIPALLAAARWRNI